MITEKVLGAYAALGGLSPDEQAAWYRKSAREWGISTFEIPFFAQTPLAPELMQAFTDLVRREAKPL